MASLWAFRFLLWYILILMVQPQNRFPILYNLRIANFTAIVCVLFHFAAFVTEKKPLIRWNPATILSLVLLFLGLLAQYFGPLKSTFEWNTDIDALVKNVLITVLVDAMAFNTARVWAVVMTLILGSLWWVKAGVRLAQAGATFAGDRLMGPAVSLVDNPNGFAYLMSLFIPMYFFLYKSTRYRYERIAMLVLMLTSVFIVFQTGSRTGFLIVAVLGCLIFPTFVRQYRMSSIVLVVGMFVVVGLISPSNIVRLKTIGASIESFMLGEYKESYEMTPDEATAQERRVKNRDTWELIKEYPILGAGIYADQTMFDRWPMARGATHNELLMAGRQMGFPGIILYVAFLLQLTWQGWTVYRSARHTWLDAANLGSLMLACAFVFIVGGIFSPGAFNPLMLILCACISALARTLRESAYATATVYE